MAFCISGPLLPSHPSCWSYCPQCCLSSLPPGHLSCWSLEAELPLHSRQTAGWMCGRVSAEHGDSGSHSPADPVCKGPRIEQEARSCGNLIAKILFPSWAISDLPPSPGRTESSFHSHNNMHMLGNTLSPKDWEMATFKEKLLGFNEYKAYFSFQKWLKYFDWNFQLRKENKGWGRKLPLKNLNSEFKFYIISKLQTVLWWEGLGNLNL